MFPVRTMISQASKYLNKKRQFVYFPVCKNTCVFSLYKARIQYFLHFPASLRLQPTISELKPEYFVNVDLGHFVGHDNRHRHPKLWKFHFYLPLGKYQKLN